MKGLLDFQYNKLTSPIIKVIGVGGGGGNAVSHMYKQDIRNISFAVCNTDSQALSSSPVPTKILIGKKGLGAGSKPNVAKQAAEDSAETIKELLSDGTEMLFVTAGMGGGTGTGAAPVLARISREMGILTVGIITIPFLFEGERKISQALDGVDAMGKEVDALLVINNERLREVYPDLNFLNAFAKADDTLTNAAKSIAEIITETGYINRDFADVKTTLKDGGVAVISSGIGEGNERLDIAIKNALHSPLLNNNAVYDAQKILIVLHFSENAQIEMKEIKAMNDFINNFKTEVNVIWGAYFDNTLGNSVKVTILASGFGLNFDKLSGKRGSIGFSIGNTLNTPKNVDNSTQKPNEKTRIEGYYGGGTFFKKTLSIVKLSLEDMDNDKLIELLEQTPTYNRDPKLLQNSLKKNDSKGEGDGKDTNLKSKKTIHFD
ncbi:MAG TPA: cell division protein FtsZ [Porphyromonadaceae bacterium]|nr:cell division protein FtsZ [Porphyromonadaceae bacterium]